MNKKLKEKIAESLSAVLPITVIVVALCITVTPMPLAPLTLFLAGACLLIIGMGFFTLGADMAMMPIGEHVGSRMAKFKKLGIIAAAVLFHRRHHHHRGAGPDRCWLTRCLRCRTWY